MLCDRFGFSCQTVVFRVVFRHSKLDFVFFREGFDPVKGE